MEREFSLIDSDTKHFEFHIWIYTNFKAGEKTIFWTMICHLKLMDLIYPFHGLYIVDI
jgi:hypothetical protein